MNRNRACKGFSMIEVLVTIVLISIGVLGVVALQGRTISYTQDSVQRNTAALLTDDLTEMMRADIANVTLDGLPKSDSPYLKADDTDFADAPEDCTSFASLTPQQRLACWAEKTVAALPGAGDLLNSDFHICRTNADDPGECNDSGSTIEIQVAWSLKSGECLDPNSADEDDNICHYRTRVEF